jgi:pyruvate dehydrogenase E1 component beta subunit
MALATEQAFSDLKCAPRRVALPDAPTPTSHAVAQYYYPRAIDLYRVACELLNMNYQEPENPLKSTQLDVPDKSFTGPF